MRRSRIVAVRAAAVIALVLAAGTSLFFVLAGPPVEPFDPVAWNPPAGFAVPAGKVDSSTAASARPLAGANVEGPEDLAVDRKGHIYTGDSRGRIMRIGRDLKSVEVFANVGGRPLGLQFDKNQNLLVANHGIGLQSISPDGKVSLLTNVAASRPILFANDLTIANDGTIYLTDSSSKYNSKTLAESPSHSVYDFLEGRPSGRLLRYEPATRLTTELRKDLYFPNGIIMSDDQMSLLVMESTRYRITKYWLAGAQAGRSETFLDKVPGILDGFDRDTRGRLLATMYDRVEALDRYVLPRVWVRHAVVRIPSSILLNGNGPAAGSILVLTDEGDVVGQMTNISPAASNLVVYGGKWLLATLGGNSIRTVAPPALPATR